MITHRPTPPPASFGLSTVEGHTGAFIRFGQWFTGRRPNGVHFTHAFLVLDDGEIIEAGPDGAGYGDLEDYLDDLDAGDDVLFVDLGLDEVERERVIMAAETLAGRGYSFLTYVYLFALRAGLPSEWLRRRVANTQRLICSQLVDEAYRLAGIHLFNDGREPQNVTPGDLARWALTDPRAAIVDIVRTY